MDVEAWLQEMTVKHGAALEVACEAAIQSGVCGVRTWSWTDDTRPNSIKFMFQARPCVDVPYGTIQDMPFGVAPTEGVPT